MKTCCGDKVSYTTEEDAVAAMFRIRSRAIHPVRKAYRCACGSWHLSKRGNTPARQCVMLQKLSREERVS